MSLDTFCAAMTEPIRMGDSHRFEFRCAPIGADRKVFLRSKWWGSETPSDEKNPMFRLRDGLIALGGSEACLPSLEEDLEKIFTRGQLWTGYGAKLMAGRPSQCHENACLLWEQNQDKLCLATGYYLSGDGMWRQHSWCVQPGKRGGNARVIETTEVAQLYFGFVMTLGETLEFGTGNTDFGIDAIPETEERYRLMEANEGKRKLRRFRNT